MTITVRAATIEELSVVQRLNAGAFAHDAVHDPSLVMTWPFDAETGGAYFRQRIDGDGVCLVACDGESIVGYLAGAVQPNESYRHGIRSELENMFVEEATRRHGVGRALIDVFREWSIDHGADEIFVSAYFDNDGAVAFYRGNGFTSYADDLLLDLRANEAAVAGSMQHASYAADQANEERGVTR